jgi:hypothetical protein
MLRARHQVLAILSMPPSYDPGAAALLTQRVLDFLSGG